MKRIQNEVGITSVYVTHDQAEALVMSDEIIVMSKGRIEQKGDPIQVYGVPVNGYVSNFIGVANQLEARVVNAGHDGPGVVEVTGGAEPLSLSCRIGEGLDVGDKTILSIRPENVHVERERPDGPSVRGEVLEVIFLGSHVDCRVVWGDFEWRIFEHPRTGLREGQTVWLRFDSEHMLAVKP